MNRELWTRYFQTFTVQPEKKVQEIDVRMIAEDCQGEVYFSDLQLQEGMPSTGHMLANQELLRREYVAGELIEKRHFNAVLRGSKIIGVPNRALPDEEQHLEERVTGGMDYTLRATSHLPPEGVVLSHFQRTRTFRLKRELRAGSSLKFKATLRRVAIDDQQIAQFSGFFHTIPGTLGKFHVDLKTARDQESDWTGSGYLLCEVDTWLKGEKW